MIANSTFLGLNFLLSQWWDPDMLPNSYIKVSYAFTIIGFMAESTLKFIDGTICKFLGYKDRIKFRFKDRIPMGLTSGVVYKFQCGFYHESYYGECVRHLNVRIGQHIGISPLTKKNVKPKGSAVSDHLLLCNHSPTIPQPKKIKNFYWNWKKAS